MTTTTLKDLYLQELQDMHNGCARSQIVTKRMAEAATDGTLKDQLSRGIEGMGHGMDRMTALMEAHGAPVDPGHVNVGLTALAEQAQAQSLDADFADAALRDVQIAANYILLSTYGIAGYETFVGHARILGLDEDASTLQTDLDNMKYGVDRLRGFVTAASERVAEAA